MVLVGKESLRQETMGRQGQSKAIADMVIIKIQILPFSEMTDVFS